jgi:hypothetical protein
MSLTSRREYLGQIQGRYQRVGRLYEQQILNEFCTNCGYERKYALKLLHGQRGVRTGNHWGRTKIYEPKELLPALKHVWLASEQPCSKRLVAALPLWLAHDPGVAVAIKKLLLVATTRDVEAALPFAILGFDCDNGSEFLNWHLVGYFAERENKVGFTRSRPYHKNANGHVEQKNWTHVRQLLGYDRLEDPTLREEINALYWDIWEPFHNYFQACIYEAEKSTPGWPHLWSQNGWAYWRDA